ncbi:hypothetical protein [Rubinisphaera italica]|uniref:Uncharacterized protein n=1 Tax=Rubinisphaera italica TaxID=2527969 RepID=A0A5C5XFP8_9PLAN|nr:hypothetical protein [Rubinisphaera italica]TWT60702.1 hypothetical protein Pan54_14290 [Rubinisphaera italica]
MKAIKFSAYMGGDIPSTWNVMARQLLGRQGQEVGPGNKGIVD